MEHLQCHDHICIDEALYGCRNTFGFRMFCKDKPAHYGLLYLNGVRVPYTFCSLLYTGKPPDDPSPFYIKSVFDLTMKLINSYGSVHEIQGRNLVTDNLYTSIILGNTLLSMGMTLVGTIRSNRKGVPKELKSFAGREEKSTVSFYEKSSKKLSITSYCVKTKSKGKKNVLVLSSLPVLPKVTLDDNKCKPAIIKLYDFCKSGTDLVDQRASKYCTAIKSNKWTKKHFCFTLDIGRINSQTIWALNNDLEPRKVNSFSYGWELASSLVVPHMKKRRSTSGLQESITSGIDRFLSNLKKSQQNEPAADQVGQVPEVLRGNQLFRNPKLGGLKRCSDCISECYGVDYKRKKEKLTKTKSCCEVCGKSCCLQHYHTVCYHCSTNLMKEVALQPDEV